MASHEVIRGEKWVAARGGEVPKGAVIGGNNKIGDIYVARAEYNGEIIPGKLIPEYGYCYISIGGSEIKTKKYEVLCDSNVNWEELEDVEDFCDIPNNAVCGGVDNEGEPIYIGRKYHGTSVTVGKVDSYTGICYVLFGKKERPFTNYEILVRTKISKAKHKSEMTQIKRSMSSLHVRNFKKTDGLLESPNIGANLRRDNGIRNVISESKKKPNILTIPNLPATTSALPSSSSTNSSGAQTWVNGTELLTVVTTDKDFQWISDKMKKNATINYDIVKVQRIRNSKTWNQYTHYRDNVIKIENNGKTNEKHLFHGSKRCQDIIKNGFDERVSNNGLFGAGVYFADNADESNGYVGAGNNGLFEMLLCRVALGKMHEVTGATKFAHAPAGFHSVKGNPSQHSEYIVYRGEQAFPGFLITYKK